MDSVNILPRHYHFPWCLLIRVARSTMVCFFLIKKGSHEVACPCKLKTFRFKRTKFPHGQISMQNHRWSLAWIGLWTFPWVCNMFATVTLKENTIWLILCELFLTLKENIRPWLFFKTEGVNFLVLSIKFMKKWLQICKRQLNLQGWFCMNWLSKLKALYSCICIICKSIDIEVIYWCMRQIWWKNTISEACKLNCRN